MIIWNEKSSIINIQSSIFESCLAHGAGDSRLRGLLEIQALQSIAADRATRKLLEIPKVSEDAAPSVGQCPIQCGLQCIEAGWRKFTVESERLERAIAKSRRDQRHRRRAAIERVLDRTIGPIDGGRERDHGHLEGSAPRS